MYIHRKEGAVRKGDEAVRIIEGDQEAVRKRD